MIGYRELSEKVGTSVSTLTEWKSLIERLTDYRFQREKKISGYFRGSRHKKPHKVVTSVISFTNDEVGLFILLKAKIAQNGRERAIREVFQNSLENLDEKQRLEKIITTLHQESADLKTDYNELVGKYNALLKAKQHVEQQHFQIQSENERLLQELNELKNRKLTARLLNKK